MSLSTAIVGERTAAMSLSTAIVSDKPRRCRRTSEIDLAERLPVSPPTAAMRAISSCG